MTTLSQLFNEADAGTQQMMMFKRLIDQVAKTPQEKIQALVSLSNLVLGPQDVKALSKQLQQPPPLPGKTPTATATSMTNTAATSTLAGTNS